MRVYRKQASITVILLSTALGGFIGFVCSPPFAFVLESFHVEPSVAERVWPILTTLGAVVGWIVYGHGPNVRYFRADIYEFLEPCRRCRTITWHVTRVYDDGREVSECETCHKVTSNDYFARFRR